MGSIPVTGTNKGFVMKANEIYNKTRLLQFYQDFDPLIIKDSNELALVPEKYVIVVKNLLVLPIILSRYGLEELKNRNFLKNEDIRIYKLADDPVDFYSDSEDGVLTDESIKDIAELFKRLNKPS